MPAYKDKKTGLFYVQFYYRDARGAKRHKTKKGFQTEFEALLWEKNFKALKDDAMDMTFADFCKVYEAEVRPRVREHTWLTKENIIESKLIPFFGDMRMCDIRPVDIVRWQNSLTGSTRADGDSFKPTYLRIINNQLNAIFNHAERYYSLEKNPVHKVDKMGSKEAGEMQFWIKDEYLRFSDAISDKPLAFYAFEVLYWMGIRCGELMALTPSDFLLETSELRRARGTRGHRHHLPLRAPFPRQARADRRRALRAEGRIGCRARIAPASAARRWRSAAPRGIRADRQHGRLEWHEPARLHHGEADRDRDNGEAVVADAAGAARLHEGACGAAPRRVRRRRARRGPPKAARPGHENLQRARRGPAIGKALSARARAQRRPLRDVAALIPGRDWEAQPLPGARARAGAARDRRRDAWATKAIRGNLMKKVYTIFIKKEECYDRSRGHR